MFFSLHHSTTFSDTFNSWARESAAGMSCIFSFEILKGFLKVLSISSSSFFLLTTNLKLLFLLCEIKWSAFFLILFFLVGYYVYIIAASPWTLPPVPYGHEGFYIPEQAHLWNHVVSQKFVVYGLSFSILWQLFELKKQKYIHLVD